MKKLIIPIQVIRDDHDPMTLEEIQNVMHIMLNDALHEYIVSHGDTESRVRARVESHQVYGKWPQEEQDKKVADGVKRVRVAKLLKRGFNAGEVTMEFKPELEDFEVGDSVKVVSKGTFVGLAGKISDIDEDHDNPIYIKLPGIGVVNFKPNELELI